RYSVVWCDRLAATEQRARLSLPELSRELNRAFGPMLGHLEVRDKPSLAPVARRSRRSLAAGPEVWIGNAAQALHPVAGQGLNLGLRDAFELADIVADAVRRGVAPQFAFERFARARRGDRSLTIALTDLMAASFTWPLARPLQSALLVTMDVVPPLRRPLARRLMFGWR
ncbi:MAG TPA: FAD-dependent monooxygenase, partial [Burkholderiaceae bacterium]|nr:FAD-dependent monooxygenase [Burkholderiaceae bacterium]